MQDIGLTPRQEYERVGYSKRDLDRFVREGQLLRAGRGWLATPGTSTEAIGALVKGRRLTCLSAASAAGLWTPPFTGTHMYTVRQAKTPAKDVSHHGGYLHAWPDDVPIADYPLMLKHICQCQGVEAALIVLDSALNKRHIFESDIEWATHLCRLRDRTVLGRATKFAQAGTETRVRNLFQSLNVPVEPQFRVPGIEYVDLRVGRWWLIECDSREYHQNGPARQEDYRRDLELSLMGYWVTRLSYTQVMYQWEDTKTKLLIALRAGCHKRPNQMLSRNSRLRAS